MMQFQSEPALSVPWVLRSAPMLMLGARIPASVERSAFNAIQPGIRAVRTRLRRADRAKSEDGHGGQVRSRRWHHGGGFRGGGRGCCQWRRCCLSRRRISFRHVFNGGLSWTYGSNTGTTFTAPFIMPPSYYYHPHRYCRWSGPIRTAQDRRIAVASPHWANHTGTYRYW